MLFRRRSLPSLLLIILLILVLVFWARSYLPDQTYFRSHQGRLLIFFASGSFLAWFDPAGAQYSGSEYIIEYCRRVAQAHSYASLRLLGFEWTNLSFKSSTPGFIAIPYWFIALLLAALAA
jgi:hypothetical protein